jgi:hypothetical protein
MSRKFLVTIILILFLLPFVSWYYLKSGLNWRKQAQEIMNGTKPFPAGSFKTAGGKALSTEDLEDYVSIISFLPCGEDQASVDVLREIYSQFKGTNKAYYILLDSCGIQRDSLADDEMKNWFVLPCNDSTDLCEVMKADWPAGKTFALVDRNKVIRSYYAIQTRDEKRTLVEHMALLLPRERQEKVELKRGDKK